MDTPEVKAFNAELSGLYENKPPISKAKMSAITKGAIKAIKFYKHVVHSVEKFIQKCKPEYKVPGLYVIDSIVRQSRHQFGQDKDVFAPRFAKNMQQTFANLFRCPPEDKRNIIRVLNLWQKNNVFGPEVIQPLLDMADPNHPLHQEIQQQQNNTANGSSLNITHNSTDNKMSPQRQDSPHASSPMGGDQFQDEPSGIPTAKFNRKLLNDFEYESEDDANSDPPLPQHSQHSQHNQHSSQNTNLPNPADALGSILTNPEIMRQLQSLQAQMQMMTGVPISNLMPMMSDMTQQNQNQNPFLNLQNNQKDQQKSTEAKDDMANESDIEFVETGPQVIEIPDANDSRSPSPVRRHRSRSRSPRRRRRSRSRSPRRRHGRDRDRERDREKSHKEREAEKEKQREREKKGLPPIKKENLSVCSTTLWVGHLSKLATPEELSDLFGAFGGVASIDVVAPRGCAFVVMERRRDAARAKAKLDKHKLHSKEITVAWAAGKGVKGREWADYWEAGLGVAYLPWPALHARWRLGALSLDALEDGGAVDEDTLPPWLPPRILPKASDNVMMVGMGGLGAPLALAPPAVPLPVPRLPPPGLTPGIPPGMAPGMPPGMRPPSIPTGVPGLQRDGSLPPGPLLGFPPGMPHSGMVGGFLGGLMGMGMGVGGLVLPLPAPALPPPQHQGSAAVSGAVQEGSDDAMELDTDEGERPDPPTLTADQIQAMLSKPPPMFNSSEPPPGFSEAAPDTSQPPPDDRHKDRRDRADSRGDRGDRRGDRDRDRRDRRDRPRDRERERDDRRDRDRRDRGRDRDTDRHRDRPSRDGQNRERSREKSPRVEKSLQERLWEMANGDAVPPAAPPPQTQPQPTDVPDESSTVPEAKGGEGGWSQLPPPRQAPPMFRAELRMRGPTTRAPIRGPWMDIQGPPGPFGPRFNGMGPPFSRPPFERPPFDGPMFERPPFNRMPFDGSRPPFDGPRPNFDGPRPPFDGPRPPFDGPRPPFDGPRPPFDGSRPPFDGQRPPFDSPRSMYDGPRPKFDGPRPPFDGPRPPFDGPRHPFDGPRPPFDGPRPPFDGPRPPFDGPRPPFDNDRGFDGDRSFDGPADNFDRGNRRFEDRGWSGERDREWDRRPEWDDRRRDRRRDEHRRDDRARRPYDRPDDRRTRDDRQDKREDKREDKRDDRRDDKREDRRDDKREDRREDKRDDKREERSSRRDKDRKSRWGAADAGDEARTDDAAEQRESQTQDNGDNLQHSSGDSAKATNNDEKYDPVDTNDDKYVPPTTGGDEKYDPIATNDNDVPPAADGNDGYDPMATNDNKFEPQTKDGNDKYDPMAVTDSEKYEPAESDNNYESTADKYKCAAIEPTTGDQGFDNHNDNKEQDRREEKEISDPVQIESHTTNVVEQDRYTEERNNDRVDDQTISKDEAVEAPKPVLDLYDANESVDTSFAVPVVQPEAKTESSAKDTDDGDMFSERTNSEA